MTPFLRQVAATYLKFHGTDISNMVFVFPNRRSGIFFQKYLALEAGRPLFSPTILTISELFSELSPLRVADRTTMLFRLFEIFIRVSGSPESFDDFVYWGEMLLNDFDDVDKYVADARKLFVNITDLKTIDSEFDYLEEEQVAIIRKFWSHFIPSYESKRKETFARTWEVLFEIYTSFRNELRKEGLAYEGMVYRDVAEELINGMRPDFKYERVVFVGLNALTNSERLLMKKLQESGVADFYWDYGVPTLTDKDNKASFFAHRNLTDFPSMYGLPVEKVTVPEIEVIGIPSAIGQTKYMHSVLEQLVGERSIPEPHHAMNTAVVLPDENLLLPALYAIPENIDPINVTMGYSLKSTPIAGLMEHIYELQRNIRYENGEPCFYFRAVIPILSHRYVSSFDSETSSGILSKIKNQNMVYVPVSELKGNSLLERIFVSVLSVRDVSRYLTSVLEYLQGGLEEEMTEEESLVVPLTELEKEFIYHYYLTINRLGDVMGKFDIAFSLGTYYRLLRKMTETITIPFRGEPLSGLQVMGVLETRGLDFENLIVLSMNEGVFPLKKAANSFIPFNLRKGFGLSTTEHQDSVFAYHFYRMIARAKRVYLIYDTRDGGMQTGEVSRFIHQMKYHYGWPIREKTLTFDISVTEPISIVMKKNGEITGRLQQYLHGGKRALSASAINVYLNCPLQFYFQYVERLKEEEEVSETMETRTFGTIFHYVMEKIYERCKDRVITADLLNNVINDHNYLEELIRYGFARFFFNKPNVNELTGFNYLIGEMLHKYVIRVLQEDKKRTPFIYEASEMGIEHEFEISGGRKVRLVASIDRVDRKENVTRIVDYKTGSGKYEFNSIAQLFDKSDERRHKQVMQVAMYSMLYDNHSDTGHIEPHIYYLRDFFKDSHNTMIEYKPAKGDESGLPAGRVSDFKEFMPEFRSAFGKCLEEIFDPETPFIQTTIEKNCAYCPFTAICRKA